MTQLMNKSPLQKASPQVPLVLLGGTMFGTMLTGCSDSPDGVRQPNRGETRYDYASRADCQRDWGEYACPEAGSSGAVVSGGGSGGNYHFYRYEQNPKSKAQTNAVKVVRGGFGGGGRVSS